MKITSQKLLLFLYTPDGKAFSAPASDISELWKELSETGKRSLLSYLKKQHYITENPYTERSYLLTPIGRDKIVSSFPFLESTQQTTKQLISLLLLKRAPRHDPNFKRLAREARKEGFCHFSRSVFVSYQEPSAGLVKMLEKSYLGSVCLFEIGDSLLHNDWIFLQEKNNYNDLIASLSGISREVGQLTKSYTMENRLNYQSKNRIFSSFDRFFALCLELKNFPFIAQEEISVIKQCLESYHFLCAEA